MSTGPARARAPSTAPALSREVVHEPFWAMAVPETFAVLGTRPDGLREEEATARRQQFGPNEIRERRRLGTVALLLRQFASPLILLLVLAGIITLFLGELISSAVIFAAVAVNTILGFWQEWKAESALALLTSYVRTRARVRREGREREHDAAELVPGDVIRISQGDRVPADARLTFVANLEVDEAILTGESLPVTKEPAPQPAGTLLADRTPMVYSGTLVVAGFADAIVTATGSATELGRIASLVAGPEPEPTPLQSAMARFTLFTSGALGLFILALFAVGVSFRYGPFEMFLIAVAVAVAAVPEGLPVAVTVILAIGVERLAKRRGIVRKLLAAETLGLTTLILTDKTGTLTQAKMELIAVVPYGVHGHEAEVLLFRASLWNTDIVLENPEDPPEAWRMFGRPLETALVRGAARSGVFLPAVAAGGTILERIPFSSAHRFSVTVVRSGSHHELVLFGAPDVLLGYTNLPAVERRTVLDTIEARALAGERVLGVATSHPTPERPKIPKDLRFSHLTFRGLVSFRDPLRREVADTIRRTAAAGVKTVIVSGDHAATAEAVGRELGLVDGRGAVLTGEDLAHLTPEELRARSGAVTVYARVTPEQKVSLVELYRSRGEVVAVTGDGVNDAPALRAADIGIALGSGTDVAKGASDLVLLDDNFETIVSAIEEGRKILTNIRKVVVYLLADSLDELFLIGGALLAGVALPVNALQILFVNFFSDSFPAVALAFEEGIDGFGREPRRLDPNLLDRTVRFLVLVIGVLTSFLLFILYYFLLARGLDPSLVRTFIFASFATYSLFFTFSVRSLERSILSYNPFSNRYLVAGVLIGLILTAAVLYVPFLQGIFGTVALPGQWVLAVLGVGLANIVLAQFGKWLCRQPFGQVR